LIQSTQRRSAHREQHGQGEAVQQQKAKEKVAPGEIITPAATSNLTPAAGK